MVVHCGPGHALVGNPQETGPQLDVETKVFGPIHELKDCTNP